MIKPNLTYEGAPHMNIAFTGHRPESLPFALDSNAYHRFEILLWHEICSRIESGYDTFYCGVARGIDIICGEIVLAEKSNRNPDLKLICVIPFKEQAQSWNTHWKKRYFDILGQADKVVQVSGSYWPGCYFARNRYMEDNCDLVIAVYNGKEKGGTAYTINYALQQNKAVVVLNPNTMKKQHL